MRVNPSRIKSFLRYVFEWLQRYPGVVALFSFVSGVASFVLVERGERAVWMVALVMLVSWFWLVLEAGLHQWMARRYGIRIPSGVLHFLTQLIHQESLFFVLPFFMMSTTWNSGQLFFSGWLVCAGLIAIIDPVYNQWLTPRRWLYLIYHTLTLFCVLLTALPIILHLTTAQSYWWAMAAAVVLSGVSLVSRFRMASASWVSQFWRAGGVVLLLLVLAGSVWTLRHWVPPATLRLTEVAVSLTMDGSARAPGTDLKSITLQQLQSQGLYAYTAIRAPRGLNERIYHVWLKDGQVVDRIALDIRGGGREQGYRAWTHKRSFTAQPVGRWQVQVLTESGQMIGVLRFQVTDSATPPG